MKQAKAITKLLQSLWLCCSNFFCIKIQLGLKNIWLLQMLASSDLKTHAML